MTAFAMPTSPNLADFQVFLGSVVQIPAAALPASSPWPAVALAQAIELVLCPPTGGLSYTLAVYNCATHLTLLITPDQPGQTWFANARSNSSTGFSLNAPPTGIVVSTSDETTSTTVVAPTWAAGLTATQLGFFRTPWGREYLGWQQTYGPNIVGLS